MIVKRRKKRRRNATVIKVLPANRVNIFVVPRILSKKSAIKSSSYVHVYCLGTSTEKLHAKSLLSLFYCFLQIAIFLETIRSTKQRFKLGRV